MAIPVGEECRLLAITVSEALGRHNLVELYNEAKELLGVGLRQAHDYVASWHRGMVYGSFSASPRKTNEKLRKLSLFLDYLQIPEKHELIRELRRDFPAFSYPPAENSEITIRLGIVQRVRGIEGEKLPELKRYLDGLQGE